MVNLDHYTFAPSHDELQDCYAAIDNWNDDDEYISCYEEVFSPENITGSLIKIYADHPEYYSDELYVDTDGAGWLGVEPAITGGHIINPASITSSYASKAGNVLHESSTKAGEDLASYSLKELFTAYPDVTSEDLADIYYRQGDEVTISPIQLAGYSAPSPQTITLASGNNNVDFVYQSLGGNNGDGSTGGNSNGSTGGGSNNQQKSTPGIPNTGMSSFIYNIRPIAISLIAVVTLLVAVVMYWRQRAQE